MSLRFCLQNELEILFLPFRFCFAKIDCLIPGKSVNDIFIFVIESI